MAPARHRRNGRWLARTAVLVAVAAGAQGTLAATAQAGTKMATGIIRTHLRSQGKYELIVYVRARTKHDRYVKIFVSGHGSERVLAKPWWGTAAYFKFTFTGKELTIRTVNAPPAVQIRTSLIRKRAKKSAPTTSTPAAAVTPAPAAPAPAPAPTPAPPPADPYGQYTTLAWEDNFAQDFVNGGSVPNQVPNSSIWSYDTWGGCGSNTLSTNVSSANPAVASLTSNGLALTATETSSGAWTSAQLDSIGHASFGPGTSIEARIELPTGQGLCPAFWMIGDNTSNEGEIDVVEAPTFAGQLTPATAYFDLHGPTNPSQEWEEPANLSLGGWHDFEITWESNAIVWSIDGTPYATADQATLNPGSWSTFSAPNTFHLLLDLAVGGWPCNSQPVGASCSPPSSATMYVQWVKVFN